MGGGGRPHPRFRRGGIRFRELGLGELLAKNAQWHFAMVEKSGWQLSHGSAAESSPQGRFCSGGLVILDESFAALDPENVSAALQCVAPPGGNLVGHSPTHEMAETRL